MCRVRNVWVVKCCWDESVFDNTEGGSQDRYKERKMSVRGSWLWSCNRVVRIIAVQVIRRALCFIACEGTQLFKHPFLPNLSSYMCFYLSQRSGQ